MKRFLPHWNWITAGTLLFSAGWIAVTALIFPSPALTSASLPQVGFLAPDFKLNTINGEIVSLSDFRGNVVLINFWASWCPPCKSEMPAIQSVYSNYSSDQLAILGVNSTFQDDLTAINLFVSENELTFPILLDINGDVSHIYRVQALPTTFFIDRQGVIQKVIYGGPLAEALIKAEINRLLEGDR